jgi:non-ribosomal peptide synthetase component F
MQFDVTVYRRTTPAGEMYVCTDGMLQRLREDGSEAAQWALGQMERLIEDAEELRFTMRVYTWGERIQCESAATDWSTGTPRLDVGRLRLLLLAKSLDMSPDEVANMHPQLGELLYAELEQRANPSPFVWSFASFRPQNCATGKPPAVAPKSRSSRRGNGEQQGST